MTRSEAITSGDDLTAANAQAVGGAKTSLKAAVRKALKENAGYRAVSVFTRRRNLPLSGVTAR